MTPTHGPVAHGDRPTFKAQTETLEYVIWTHGSALSVESSERFGQIRRRRTGLHLHSRSVPRGEFVVGQSDVIAAIATPAYALGKQFYVRSVLVEMDSDPVSFDVLGRPVATPIDASVWDGDQRMASAEIRAASTNRHVRLPISSSHRVRSGIAVSLDVIVLAVLESAPGHWLEIHAVGVEFVTRGGGVVVAEQ